MSNTVPALRQACLDEAVRAIESDGIENLSLRKIARRLGVSHQAPYKHFQSRDHLLAELTANVFEEFGEFMEQRSQQAGVANELLGMGLAYVEYALANPLKYDLMFAADSPTPASHPVILRGSDKCYRLLRASLGRTAYARRPEITDEILERDALLIFVLIHGLVSALTSEALKRMPVADDARLHAIEHTFARIGSVLGSPPPSRAELNEISQSISQAFPKLQGA